DVSHILHAGDIGDPDILIALETVAPVTAVWGNTDGFAIRARVPEIATVELDGRALVVVHGHQFGSPSPAALQRAFSQADVVVFGHTHRPATEWIGDGLYLNPGGAGAPRFRLRPSIALLELREGDADVRLIEL
ncbi:MAG: metallophosphoesterase family protein, partial [Longimicrobiales bacterium]